MENVNCFRCGNLIKGEFKIVEGKILGPSCYALFLKRNRIRAAIPSQIQTTPDYVDTELCHGSCLDCIYFNQSKCPQEDSFKGTLGRRR